MDRSAIILAGDVSSKFEQDKGFLELANKPLIKHVVDAVDSVVDETIVVTNSQEQATKYAKLMTAEVKFAVAMGKLRSPLIGALTGFSAAQNEYSLLLPSSTPFVSKEVISLLFELCINKSAVIPRWPNCQIEPLHAVYQTKLALEAAKAAVVEEKLNVHAMIEKLRGVRYVSTLVIQQLDPDFRTFFNVNTPVDLKRAMVMVKPRKRK